MPRWLPTLSIGARIGGSADRSMPAARRGWAAGLKVVRPCGLTSAASLALLSSVNTLAPWLPPESSMVRRGLRLGLRVLQALRSHHAGTAASAMAYSFFLSLIPLLLCLGYVFGYFVRGRGVDAALEPILDAAPAGAARLLVVEADRLASTQGAAKVAPVAAFGFFFIASSGVAGLMDVLTLTSRGLRRPWWKTRLVALGFVIVGFAVVLATCAAVVRLGLSGAVAQAHAEGTGVVGAGQGEKARDTLSAEEGQFWQATSPPVGAVPTKTSVGVAAIGTAATVGRHAASRVRFLISPSQRNLLSLSALALGVAGVAAFYRVAVHRTRTVRRRIWPGALLAVAIWVVVTAGFGAYVTQLGRYHVYYGGLAAIAVLLFWFWLTALALIIGAELNAQLEGARDEPGDRVSRTSTASPGPAAERASPEATGASGEPATAGALALPRSGAHGAHQAASPLAGPMGHADDVSTGGDRDDDPRVFPRVVH